jgi:hypothetical protein
MIAAAGIANSSIGLLTHVYYDETLGRIVANLTVRRVVFVMRRRSCWAMTGADQQIVCEIPPANE